MVLPVRRRSARPADGAESHPGEARVSSRGRHARPPRANQRLRLVEPDRDRGPDPADESSGGARLRLRERPRPRVLRVSGAAAGPPLGREVAVEVDASGVLSPSEGEAVRVEVGDDPEIDRGEERARMRVTAVPAHSFPWMQPTTSARVGLVGSPARKARERPAPGRPSDADAPLGVGPDPYVHVVVVVDRAARPSAWARGGRLAARRRPSRRRPARSASRAPAPAPGRPARGGPARAPARRASGSRRPRRARSDARRDRARRSACRRRPPAAARGRPRPPGWPPDAPRRTRRLPGAAFGVAGRCPSDATAGSASASAPDPR